jgi:hypothetical protein
VGGAAEVVDAGAVRGTGGVEGTTWGTTEVVGTALEAAEAGEAGDGGVAQGRAVGPLDLFHRRSDHLGSRSDHQPLFHGWFDRMGSLSDRHPLFWARSDRPDVRSDRQQRPAVESLVERGAPIVVQVWELHQESHPTERCLNR